VPADDRSWPLTATQDGRYVLIGSEAGNLAPGWGRSNIGRLYLRDRRTGPTELVSVSGRDDRADVWAPQGDVSDDGRYVIFGMIDTDAATNDDLFVYDRRIHTAVGEVTACNRRPMWPQSSAKLALASSPDHAYPQGQ
jgi:hypothetical protein